jgi:hypothetical protein
MITASPYKNLAALEVSILELSAPTYELSLCNGRRHFSRRLELVVAAGGGRIIQSSDKCPNKKLSTLLSASNALLEKYLGLQ